MEGKMYYRIRQLYRFLFVPYKKKYNYFVRLFLNKEEYELFKNMKRYDKVHSFAVLIGILRTGYNEKYPILAKLALLHDVGKSKNYTLLDRILAVFRKDIRHCQNGYAMLKNINEDLAHYVLCHHDKSYDEILRIFKQIDNKN